MNLPDWQKVLAVVVVLLVAAVLIAVLVREEQPTSVQTAPTPIPTPVPTPAFTPIPTPPTPALIGLDDFLALEEPEVEIMVAGANLHLAALDESYRLCPHTVADEADRIVELVGETATDIADLASGVLMAKEDWVEFYGIYVRGMGAFSRDMADLCGGTSFHGD